MTFRSGTNTEPAGQMLTFAVESQQVGSQIIVILFDTAAIKFQSSVVTKKRVLRFCPFKIMTDVSLSSSLCKVISSRKKKFAKLNKSCFF